MSMELDREVIVIQVGQTGIQMGQAIWEMLSAEHGILKDGVMHKKDFGQSNVATFFHQAASGSYVPRALFMDLEATVIDEVRAGQYRNLYHPDCFVNALDDSASNFARAYYTTGAHVVTKYTHHLRRMIEECEHLQAFMVVHSQGGGTGAGLCSKVMEHCSDTLGKITKLEFPIIPSPIFSNSIVEPYNAILGNHFCMDHSDICMLLDNEAMYEICMRFLNLQCPTFYHLNRMVAHLVSTLTCNLRFQGVLRADLNQLSTNLVPYPRIHFLINSFAPFLSRDRSDHENLSIPVITRMTFSPDYQMSKMMTELGKFMSIGLFYRGDVTPRGVNEAINEIKGESELKFVDWCPTGYKISINSQPSTCVPGGLIANSPRFVSMMGNNTAASQVFQRIVTKFQALYLKRSFVHWYVGEGLEEGEFAEGVENIKALVKDYQECGLETVGYGANDDGTEGENTEEKVESSKANEGQADDNTIEENQENQETTEKSEGE